MPLCRASSRPCKTTPILTDVNSDQQQTGLETDVIIDRDTASRLGLAMSQIDNTLYDAFGQRQVSTIYSAINQYHVVMEVAPRYWQDPSILKSLYVSTAGASPSGVSTTNAVVGTVTQTPALPAPGSSPASSTGEAATQAGIEARNAQTNALANTGRQGTSSGAAVSTAEETMVPLAAISHFDPGHTPLSVNHQGLFVASTISFNLRPGAALGDADQRNRAGDERSSTPPPRFTAACKAPRGPSRNLLANERFLLLAALGHDLHCPRHPL